MATYYVGIGGNDGNNGTTWALRKLTLNGAEDIPVAANDTVYVGPGVYREMLTLDVSGSAGNPITYIADVSGEHTDGVGGTVRITGSDNDTTSARNYCITDGGNTRNYRTFRGFLFDMAAIHSIATTGSATNWVVEDCAFLGLASGTYAIYVWGDSQADWTITRCFFPVGGGAYAIIFASSAGITDAGHSVTNCFFLPATGGGINSDDVGGITVRNGTFYSGTYGIRVTDALPVGYTAIAVTNCIFYGIATYALRAVNVGEIVEDYNTFFSNGNDRSSVSTGGNSVAYPPLFDAPIQHAGASQVSGFRYPWWFGHLSEWSAIRAITGSNEQSIDFHGILRPATAAKNSWGAFQFHDRERETTTTHGGSTASIVFNDAGSHQIFVPVDGSQITASVYCYREANYAGTNPRMVIKQPGQSDRTTTDAAAASQWNLLTDTFTPSATPPYIVVELQSSNTDAANPATNDCFFDDLTVV